MKPPSTLFGSRSWNLFIRNLIDFFGEETQTVQEVLTLINSRGKISQNGAEFQVECFWCHVYHSTYKTIICLFYNDARWLFVFCCRIIFCIRPCLNEIINFGRRSALLCWWDKYEFLIKFSFFFPSSSPLFRFPPALFCAVPCVLAILKLNVSLNDSSDREVAKEKFQLWSSTQLFFILVRD